MPDQTSYALGEWVANVEKRLDINEFDIREIFKRLKCLEDRLDVEIVQRVQLLSNVEALHDKHKEMEGAIAGRDKEVDTIDRRISQIKLDISDLEKSAYGEIDVDEPVSDWMAAHLESHVKEILRETVLTIKVE